MENFTTYTEVDPNSQIAKTSSRVTGTNVVRGQVAYVNDNKGPVFDGDFTHDFEWFLTSHTGESLVAYWGVSNEDTTMNLSTDSIFMFTAHPVGTDTIRLRERDSSTNYTDDYTIADQSGTLFYMTAERDESVGTYGTIYLYIYSDSGRTVLLDTLSIALHSSKKDFSRIFAISAWSSGAGLPESAYLQNLELNLPEPEGVGALVNGGLINTGLTRGRLVN